MYTEFKNKNSENTLRNVSDITFHDSSAPLTVSMPQSKLRQSITVKQYCKIL